MLLPTHPGFASASGDNVTVYYQDQIPANLVDGVLAYARAGHERCRSFWGEPPGGVGQISIYLCNSRAGYLQLSGGGGGNASAAGSNILLYPAGVGEKNLGAVVRHEMSHAYLRQHVGYLESFGVPAWLNDGIATYLGTPTWASAKALEKNLEAMPTPEIVSVESLTSRLEWADAFSRGPKAVARQYACVRSFADYLVAQHGEESLKRLVHQSLREDVDDAFASVYAAELTEVQRGWLTHEIAAGRIPPETQLVLRSPGLVTAIRFVLPYAIILFAMFWVIRQCFVLGRLLMRLRRA